MIIRYFSAYFVTNPIAANLDIMHYLVTGGAGFIGSNLIRRLFAANNEVLITCVDDFDPFYSKEIKELNISGFKNNPNFCLLNIDLATTSPKELAKQITSPVDVIIHLAAKAGVRPSILNPLSYQQANVTRVAKSS